ncbi:MAG: family 78 glycoside hydrolase catalytic domain [Fimbriimonas sp.]|nr:family 78 glycoside hydrolase catalytic domain [Fimbriimonas sp.]
MSLLFLATTMLAGPTIVSATDLRCEYLNNPLGIEETHPRFSWVDASEGRNARQLAYRIIVSSSPSLLKRDRGDLWDTGKVTSDQTAQIEYTGRPLQSRQHAWWKVAIWNAYGQQSPYSAPGQWEMGLLNRSDWQGKWIGLAKKQSSALTLDGASWIWYPEGDMEAGMPLGSVFLQKKLSVDGRSSIVAASIGIAADDHFVLMVNGKQAGKGSGWQSLHTLDIRQYLQAGENTIQVEGINDTGPAGVALTGRIAFADGSVQNLKSDDSWQAAKSPDDTWQSAKVLGEVGMQPWGKPGAPKENGPAPYLRKGFTVGSSVVKARVYASALGLYKLYIDGKPVSQDIFRPGWTDYRKRVQYQTYDVTPLLKPGKHAIGMVLGNGWYCGRVGWTLGQNYGPQAMGLVQLEIQERNGRLQRIASDATWRAGTGAILADDLLDGETFDSRQEPYAWSTKLFSDSKWSTPLVQPLTRIALNAQQSRSVERLQEIRPLTIKENPKGSFIFDMGQNMVGWARLKAKGPAGTAVRIRFAEMLNPDGTIYVTNLRSAKATDTYVLHGGSTEVYEPSFTFHGFRYVEVTGYPGMPTKDSITGVVVGTDNPQVGEFACSNPLVNQLAHNIFWGERGNYLEVPTDCPQRDERLGWMGDAQIFVRTATFFNDIAPFMTKWTRDVEDAQSAKGGYSDVSPRLVDNSDGAPAWGDAGVIVPWTIYEAYGDKRILARHYDSMARWIDYIDKPNPNHIWVNNSNANFGDWLNVGDDTPRPVLATMFFAHSVDLMSKIAKVLGKKSDAMRYGLLFDNIKLAYNREFVAPDGTIKGDSQSAYVISLWFNLLPEDKRRIAIQKLANLIVVKKKNHLSTGFLGVGYICPTLTSMGRTDIAYRLLQNDTYPSWGYSIRQGATTIWERWDGWRNDKGFQDPGMNSFNHYSMGSVGEWMMSRVAGLDWDVDDPGYRHILMHPTPGGGLTYAKASLNSLRGLIKIQWKQLANHLFTIDVTVPPNTYATLFVPSRNPSHIMEGNQLASRSNGVLGFSASKVEAVMEVASGTYHFRTTL